MRDLKGEVTGTLSDVAHRSHKQFPSFSQTYYDVAWSFVLELNLEEACYHETTRIFGKIKVEVGLALRLQESKEAWELIEKLR